MAHTEALNALSVHYAERHGRASLDDLRSLAGRYIRARSLSILDAAAIGLAFDAIFSEPSIDITKITPQMASAWEQAYPHVPIESLAGRSAEELAGAINGWKGKLFEVEVAERLNNGEWVGDLRLEPGQKVEPATSPTQPGWDLQIINDDGSPVDMLQLKATESVSYVHQALARYPDTPILTTEEVASQIGDHAMIFDSGISNDELTGSIKEHLADATPDAAVDVLSGTLPVSVILATEAYKVLNGQKSTAEALNSGTDRLTKAAIAGGVGTAVSLVATPLAGVVASMLTRFMLGGESAPEPLPNTIHIPPDMPRMHGKLGQTKCATASLTRYYPCPAIAASSTAETKAELSDQEELLALVDPATRLSVLQGATPLDHWIRSMLAKDMAHMDRLSLEQHLGDLLSIRDSNMVEAAFPAAGLAGKIVRAFDSEYRKMGQKLRDTIRAGCLYRKRLDTPLSEQEAEEIELLKLSPQERIKLAAEKRKAELRAEAEKRIAEIRKEK